MQTVPPATHVEAADQAPRLVALARPTPSPWRPKNKKKTSEGRDNNSR